MLSCKIVVPWRFQMVIAAHYTFLATHAAQGYININEIKETTFKAVSLSQWEGEKVKPVPVHIEI